jgi:hypothetical protein
MAASAIAQKNPSYFPQMTFNQEGFCITSKPVLCSKHQDVILDKNIDKNVILTD